MRKCREASNTAALSFSRPVLQRSADFVKRRWASRSAAESFSETSATVLAECARSPFSVLKGVESEEDSLKQITDARQLAASAAGKSSGKKYSRALAAREREQPECRFHEPATGSGRSRTVSHLVPTASLQADAATGCEPSLFLVGRVRPFSVGEIDQKSPTCHYAILPAKFLTIQFPIWRPNPIECPPKVTWVPLPREREGEGESGFRATASFDPSP